MTSLVTVEFELTPSQRDCVKAWVGKEHGSDLQPVDFKPYLTTPRQENPAEKQHYVATLRSDYRLSAPKKITDLIVKG